MNELLSLERGGKCATNQVLYNLQNREIEFDLLPFLTSKIELQTSSIPVMAYSPVGHSGAFLGNGALKKIAQSHDATCAQIALAWVLKRSKVMLPIPGTSKVKHLEENTAAAAISLGDDDFKVLDEQGQAAWRAAQGTSG